MSDQLQRDGRSSISDSSRWRWLAFGLMTAAVVALFCTASLDGEFGWYDPPGHSLNGAFIKDLVMDLPLEDPWGYAVRYYVQYPALTIGFYPPILYVAEALSYGIFGVSQFSAMLAVGLFYIGLAWGAYTLARLWLPSVQSLALALTLISVPEISLWGRQVMPEIPAYAFMTWAAVFLFRYQQTRSPRSLYAITMFLLLAVYTKQTSVFLVPVVAVSLLVADGWKVLRDRHVWFSTATFLVCMLPLTIMTLKFGQMYTGALTNIDTEDQDRFLGGAFYYFEQLPQSIGWPIVLLVLAFFGWALAKRGDGIARPVIVFFVLWFVAGIGFHNLFAHKEPRYGTFMLLPLVVFAFLLIGRFGAPRWRMATSLALAISYFAYAIVVIRADRHVGYRAAAMYAADHAPPNSMVFYFGDFDPTFVFNIRTREDRRDLTVVRGDKLLLRYGMMKSRGVGERVSNDRDIGDKLNKSGVHIAVVQSGWWVDIGAIQGLHRVLDSPQFERVARFPISSNIPSKNAELLVFRNLGDVAKGPIKLDLELLTIGRTLSGTAGRPGD